MKKITVMIQGKKVSPNIQYIQELISNNPSWGRKKLSIELCERWNWRNPKGQLKDMSCRNLLLKLDRTSCIILPAPLRKANNNSRNRVISFIPHSTDKLVCTLKNQTPLQIIQTEPNTSHHALFQCLVSTYHYLGHKNSVGENLKYLVLSRSGCPLACVLFGSAAWKIQPRDSFIGWPSRLREKNLGYIANNTRFLIFPWVKIPNLASHILSKVSQRLNLDWLKKYGHSIYLLETFVDRSRFQGTCYRAANWILVGQTQGRTRNDRTHTIQNPFKDIYVFPLTKKFRSELGNET